MTSYNSNSQNNNNSLNSNFYLIGIISPNVNLPNKYSWRCSLIRNFTAQTTTVCFLHDFKANITYSYAMSRDIIIVQTTRNLEYKSILVRPRSSHGNEIMSQLRSSVTISALMILNLVGQTKMKTGIELQCIYIGAMRDGVILARGERLWHQLSTIWV